MASYYVDSSVESSGDGSLASPWKLIANITGLASGDTVYFKKDGTWTEKLTCVTGVSYGMYGDGTEKPYIDMSGNAANSSCIEFPYNTYSITVSDFRVWGSGGKAAVDFIQAGSGGGGYSCKCYRVDILGNYGSSDAGNNHDGFSASGDTYQSEIELHDCTATKCRENPASTGSHQALTIHASAKARIYDFTCSDCNYGIANVGFDWSLVRQA